MPKIVGLVFFLLAAAASRPVDAAEVPESWCSPSDADRVVARALSEDRERRLIRERGFLPKSHDVIYQEGDIAVIDADDAAFFAPKSFDLHGKEIQFLRRPKGMSAVRAAVGFKDLIGEKIELGDDDAVEIVFPPDFRYPFGERVWDRVWVGSDGHLTFGGPEASSLPRTLGRFLNGPPRIAPLFTDLDPSQTSGSDGVYVAIIPGRVRVTWVGVPEFGTGNRNTFQITLFETGRALVVYSDEIAADHPVVGVRAFDDGPMHLMDYDAELPYRPQRTAIAEQFNELELPDRFAVSQRFLQHFRDVYDSLIIWTHFPSELPGGAFASEITVKNDVGGIGKDLFNDSYFVGSDGRLASVVEMGGLSRYPEDPEEIFFRRIDSTLSVVAHEFGHRWLAQLRIAVPAGQNDGVLLGRQDAHWSFYMHTEGSVMEGNFLRDNGDGSFTTQRTSYRFSDLDQYVMGLIRPAQVPPFFYLTNAFDAAGAFDENSNPRPNLTLNGDRVDATLEDIVAVEGPRTPTSAEARKEFRVGFIVLGREDDPVSDATIVKMERIRAAFVDWFEDAVDGNGRILTELIPR